MKSLGMKKNKEDIISIEDIKMILDTYRIGKKPLAKLLGWGETTIIRYIEGDIPTNEYSNKLKSILENPEYYYELLIEKKEMLTNVAFRKSEKAVLAKIMDSKMNAVVHYIVHKSNAELSASYIQYLLYYIQAFSLALYDKEIFTEEYEINVECKPYYKLYEKMMLTGVNKLEVKTDYFSPEEIYLIDSIYDNFTWLGPKALNAMLSFERNKMLNINPADDTIIKKETMKAYFKEIVLRYHITSVREIKKYPQKRLYEISTTA